MMMLEIWSVYNLIMEANLADNDGAVLTTGTIALFAMILGPVVSALVYIHKRLMDGEAEKLKKVLEIANERYNDIKEDRDFIREQANEKDTTQLEAILALREGISAVRGVGQDVTTLKDQLARQSHLIEYLVKQLEDLKPDVRI